MQSGQQIVLLCRRLLRGYYPGAITSGVFLQRSANPPLPERMLNQRHLEPAEWFQVLRLAVPPITPNPLGHILSPLCIPLILQSSPSLRPPSPAPPIDTPCGPNVNIPIFPRVPSCQPELPQIPLTNELGRPAFIAFSEAT